jgi:D-sedoheptulose 7-phosphate isomerase
MRTPPLPASWTDDLARLLDAAEATGPQGRPVAQDEAFSAAIALILEARRTGRKVMVLGNGGSAAIASHLQTDLAHSLKVRALVFTEPSTLTAQANDHGYEHAFANLVELWAEPGDLVVAISSSGRSPNILNACGIARGLGARLLTYSGFRADNPLRTLGDLNFHVASTRYGPVESAHAVLIHHLTDLVLATLSSEVPA